MAKAAIEPALWDLYGKITKKSIRQLIGAELESCEATALAGAVIGIMPLQETITAIESLVKQGYTRVKLKVQNAKGIELARAVRECFPNLMIMLDANQAFTESDVAILQSLDNLNIRCIEEPLTPKNDNSADIFTRLERLQENIKTPICLDESIITQGDIDRVLNSPNLRCIALKIAKWGGLTPALRFYERALKLGFDIWMGGMYESGVSKNMHAAFETLPGIEIPGDLSSTSHYFKTDICEPKFSAQNGLIYLNLPGHENGLGCVLDHESINQILVEKKVFKRD